MEKIGFFGGCFNPVTNAHLDSIKKIIEEKNLKKVYFVPMGDLYSKKDLIPLKHRIEMLKLAFQNDKRLDILDISNKTQRTTAIDTFQIIDEKFPNFQRFFIMGSDNYKKMSSWKDFENLKKYNYIILDRENGNTKDISSSLVRERILNNRKIDDLVPKTIIEYINKNNLYK